jgi:acyl transferase domain-containing protein/phosphopantetheinyl transferase
MTSSRSGDIAIIGMACLFPQAPDLQSYWRNIISKRDGITDPTVSGDVDGMYDPQSNDDTHLYCKRGGYLGKLASFEPLGFGIMPKAINAGEPDQWLALKVCRDALNDAGYRDAIPERNRTAVVLGKGNYLNRGNAAVVQRGAFIEQMLEVLRHLHPEYTEGELQRIRLELKTQLPSFDADTVPGLIPNIVAGRIANRLDLMGPAYTIDAACASSLVAVDLGAQYLASHECDLAVAGGVHVTTQLQIRQVFCRLGALSRAETIRPFDRKADGTLIGEGVGALILKRLPDAVRDGHRIYAVVKGLGVASDGRGLSVTAPRLQGEVLALERAYNKAGIEPRSIALIEAHGTGTPVGDATEVAAIMQVLGKRARPLPWCALGSVKSMFGHLMPAAGMAALIKTALALYHKTLPATMNVTEPLNDFQSPDCALVLNTETRPWVHANLPSPRRAAVNAFGFGGINAHAILEEAPDPVSTRRKQLLFAWDSELFVFSGMDRADLHSAMNRFREFLNDASGGDLKDLAFTLNTGESGGDCKLAIVASSHADLKSKIDKALMRLSEPSCRQIRDPQGVYYFERRLAQEGKLAFVFPGEGSQFPGMLSDLCMIFPEVMNQFDLADRAYTQAGADILPSEFIFPASGLTEKDAALAKQRLWGMDGAISAILTANSALFELLTNLGIRPDCVLGHSTGEFSAMMASGMLDLDCLQNQLQFGEDLYRVYISSARESNVDVSLLAVGTDSQTVEEVLNKTGGLVLIAMDNCPLQTVISGDPDSVERAMRELQSRGVICEGLSFNRPYHTPAFSSFIEPLRKLLSRWVVNPPAVPAYTCATKTWFPSELDEIRNVAAEQWVRPVAFRETVEAMYADGVRIFVEVGARGNLSSFILNTLRGRAFLALPTAPENKSSITALHHLLGILSAQGLTLELDHLYSQRDPQKIQLKGAPATDPNLKHAVPIPISLDWPVVQISRQRGTALRHNSALPAAAGRAEAPQRTAQEIAPLALPEQNTMRLPGSALNGGTRVLATEPKVKAVMSTHLQTMDKFLVLQQDLMRNYLSRKGSAAPPTFTEASANGRNQPSDLALPIEKPPAKSNAHGAGQDLSNKPLISAVPSIIPGKRAIAECVLDVSEHIYLKDHTFARDISAIDPTANGLPVQPLTMSLEFMAETASLVANGPALIAIKNVRAQKWIVPESGPILLSATAELSSREKGEVFVRMYEISPNPTDSPQPRAWAVEASFQFATQYPTAPSVQIPTSGAEPSKWPEGRVYKDAMFHGPVFRGVRSIDWVEDKEIQGTLSVPVRSHLLASDANPQFLLDPVLLDAAAQTIGVWVQTRSPDHLFFPFFIKQISFFAAPLEPGETAKSLARLKNTDNDQLSADLAVIFADGRVCLQIESWTNRRFRIPARYQRFWLAPAQSYLSEVWQASGLEMRRLDSTLLPVGILEIGGGIWGRTLAHSVLSRSEEQFWKSTNFSESRRIEWLCGRIAAKDAVRRYVRDRYGLTLCPADIEIWPDDKGRPRIRGAWVDRVPVPPAVSISHSGEFVAAAAVDGFESVGIDIEPITRLAKLKSGDHEFLLSPKESSILAALPARHDAIWRLRAWCAKEAAAKALGCGLGSGFLSLAIENIDASSGAFVIHSAESSCNLQVSTAVDQELVIATCLQKKEQI